MNKVLFTLALLGMIMGMACDNDNMNEPNPYPDGVYPFEVTNVGHTQENYNNFTVTWVPPDKGFTGVRAELFIIVSPNPETPYEDMVYSSVTGINNESSVSMKYKDFVTGKNSLSFHTTAGNDHYVIIKCVDKFGNVSEGIRYEFSWSS